jgi:Holliday junction DNA helicase RuvA
MIARLTGTLEETLPGSVLVDTGAGLVYEALVPACDLEVLAERRGRPVTLHTLHYIEGDPSRGQVIPRLIGFSSPQDRRFFQLYTTVKGIGMRKALRSLVRPLEEVAAAIQAADAKYLTALPEIGKRTAEQIIAELRDRVGEFAGQPAAAPGQAAKAQTPAPDEALPEAGRDAVAVLVQLGEKRPDAVDLIERVLAVSPELQGVEAILQQAYRLKGAAR